MSRLATLDGVVRKAISTNLPAVACDVCGRTLLRGEHGNVFLHGGSRHMVCELCTQRAAHEGWIREGLDQVSVRSRDSGARRRGSMLGRLRPRRTDAPVLAEHEPSRRSPRTPARQSHDVVADSPRSVHAVPTNADLKMARALDVFNSSRYPRTIAGVARSLGAPVVAVRPSSHEGSVVDVAVSWELSWYRYEVDLADELTGPRVIGHGTDLIELDPAEQQPNAAADDAGCLHLVAAPA